MNEKSHSFVYGTAWKKEKTKDLVVKAVQAGFESIDTANHPKHYNEPGVGEALVELASLGFPREKLFLQTKFTPADGHDQRAPYDTSAELTVQVEQSFQSTLEHLHTDYLDSYLLHGPYNYPGLGDEDWEVWKAIEKLYKSGQAKLIGISNVNHIQLEVMMASADIKPMVVQNRCFANRGWDKLVREICLKHKIVYQGFSLLTANVPVLEDPRVSAIAKRLGLTAAQVIFLFSKQIGMVPMTGTTRENHMKEDLSALGHELTPAEIETIENIALI